MDFLVRFCANLAFLGVIIVLANVFTVWLRDNFPFIALSRYHYFIAMFIWCTLVSTIDIWMPYGNVEYTISTTIHDILMASVLTLINEYLQNKNF